MKTKNVIRAILLLHLCALGFALEAAVPTVTVTTVEGLKKMLASDFQGIIFIPDGPAFNLYGYRDLPLHEGVTLKGTRSRTTPGRLLYTNDLREKHNLFQIMGSNVRVEGLRFRGPSSSEDEVNKVTAIRIVTADEAAHKVHQNIVVTNNEFYAWPGSAISVAGILDYARCFADLPSVERTTRPWHVMSKATAGEVAIIRNYIHHNQRQDSGYGVVVGSGAYALIQGNVFDFNRHAVAHSGDPYTGYIARDNYNLQQVKQQGLDPFGYWPTHYDVHGCGSNGFGGDAGEYIEVAYNTIRGAQDIGLGVGVRKAFHVRGVPHNSAWFIENVLVHDDLGDAIKCYGSCQNVYAEGEGNEFNVDHSLDLGVGDFDGDGHDDVFVATGAGWYYSSSGIGPWQWLTRAERQLADVRIGDFDGDGYSDVFTTDGSTWRYFSGRLRTWVDLGTSSAIDIAYLGFGDFDGNGITDVFRANGLQWYISWDARSSWDLVNSSQYTVKDLRFGDFDGDGATDVFMVGGGDWRYSSGAQTRWITLQDKRADLAAIRLGDFDGDGYTDVAYETSSEWRFSPRGTGATVRLRDKNADLNTSIHKGVLGKFSWGIDGARDAFVRFGEIAIPYHVSRPIGSRTGLRFVYWYYFPATNHQAFAQLSPQNMR